MQWTIYPPPYCECKLHKIDGPGTYSEIFLQVLYDPGSPNQWLICLKPRCHIVLGFLKKNHWRSRQHASKCSKIEDFERGLSQMHELNSWFSHKSFKLVMKPSVKVLHNLCIVHESGKKKKKKKKKSLFFCFSPFPDNSQPRVWAPYLIPRYLSNNLLFKMGDFHSPSIMEKWLLFNGLPFARKESPTSLLLWSHNWTKRKSIVNNILWLWDFQIKHLCGDFLLGTGWSCFVTHMIILCGTMSHTMYKWSCKWRYSCVTYPYSVLLWFWPIVGPIDFS